MNSGPLVLQTIQVTAGKHIYVCDIAYGQKRQSIQFQSKALMKAIVAKNHATKPKEPPFLHNKAVMKPHLMKLFVTKLTKDC